MTEPTTFHKKLWDSLKTNSIHHFAEDESVKIISLMIGSIPRSFGIYNQSGQHRLSRNWLRIDLPLFGSTVWSHAKLFNRMVTNTMYFLPISWADFLTLICIYYCAREFSHEGKRKLYQVISGIQNHFILKDI